MSLRISINATRIEGPWGGGNRFVSYLDRFLTSRGHEVFRDLQPDLDLILLIGVQPELRVVSYSPAEAAEYVQRYPQAARVLRINNCDEAHGSDRGINRRMLAAAESVDHVVFPSGFSQDHFCGLGLSQDIPRSVIKTGVDASIFKPAGPRVLADGEPMRLVTHHWSTHPMKGFDIYERLDSLIGSESQGGGYELTYIGPRAAGMRLPHSRWLEPMDGRALAEEIGRHHALVTGARYEAGGNHYIEAMSCGLPVLFLKSGATPEYCQNHGLGFRPHEFESKLSEFRGQYARYAAAVAGQDFTARSMAERYEQLFVEVVKARRDRRFRQPGVVGRCRYRAVRVRRAVGRRLPKLKRKAR